jgi:DNA excision repair protein ERCC-4
MRLIKVEWVLRLRCVILAKAGAAIEGIPRLALVRCKMDFINQIFMDVLAEDGLVVLARGLGMDALLLKFFQLYSDPCSLVLVLGTNSAEEEYYIDELLAMGVPQLPKVITNEFSAKERESLYMQGGVLFITSRILVVDMLRKTCPLDKVAGIMVCHAHKISEPNEVFIARLFRQDNKVGFIKAFSDIPEMLCGQFAKIERIMKNLFVRNLYIWPRFHASVVASLFQHRPDVVELRQKMTPLMCTIQVAILDIMKSCLEELHRGNPGLDQELLSLETSLTKTFNAVISLQLDPLWHQLGFKTKQLVSDLKALRTLLYYLTQYDCVSFYRYLENFTNKEGGVKGFSDHSGWIFMDAANTLFTEARRRVYGDTVLKNTKGKSSKKAQDTKEVKPEDMLLEISPKWTLLKEVLDEISTDIQSSPEDDVRVLVVANDDRTCSQLKEHISGNGRGLLERSILRMTGSSSSRVGDGKSRGFKKATSTNSLKDNTSSKNSGSSKLRMTTRSTSKGGEDKDQPPLSKKLKVECTDHGEEEVIDCTDSADEQIMEEQQDAVDDDFRSEIVLEPQEMKMLTAEFLRPREESSLDRCFGVLGSGVVAFHSLESGRHSYYFSKLLKDWRPRYVVLYDPNVNCVRQLEIHKSLNPGIPLRVYVLFYDSSVEEQRYLTSLRREKEAFHQLIKEKGHMVIPEEQEGRTVEPNNLMRGSSSVVSDAISSRKAGGKSTEEQKILVDVREMRSALPSLIHKRGIEIIPLTLEVGDYILTPEVCVERKSPSDLVSSLNSGRLYNQVTAMMRHYKKPMLLIEFSEGQSFSLQPKTALTGDISLQSVTSKLTLLTLHFPKLRLLWTQTPNATAELFEELKVEYVHVHFSGISE